MKPESSPASTRRRQLFELWFAAATIGLLLYAVANWRGWVGPSNPYKPWQSVLMAGGFACGALGHIVRRRSIPIGFLLLVSGFVLVVSSVLAG